ncbi:MAG: hypothetical protein WC551_10290 [Patescibacteria group bacterium]
MSAENGNVKWPQAAMIAVSLLGISVGIATATTDKIQKNEAACRDRRDAVMIVMESNQREVIQRLIRIETKLEK